MSDVNTNDTDEEGRPGIIQRGLREQMAEALYKGVSTLRTSFWLPRENVLPDLIFKRMVEIQLLYELFHF